LNDDALRLVNSIFLAPTQEPPRLVVFAGVEHGSGCSQIAAAVAKLLAKDGRRKVCLVEANFRSPALPALFRTPNHFGLTEALTRDGEVRSFAKPTATHPDLWLLSSGALSSESPSLLTSLALKDRLAELRSEFDFIVVDAPPLLRYPDAIPLGQLSDGLVLVLEAGCTKREVAANAASSLRASKVPVLAAVLNKVAPRTQA
jgi:receptor protein-tyrosine kinase